MGRTKIDRAPKSGNSADRKQNREATSGVPERADSLRIEPLMLRPHAQHIIDHTVNMTPSPDEIPLGKGVAAILVVVAGVGHGGHDEAGPCQRNPVS